MIFDINFTNKDNKIILKIISKRLFQKIVLKPWGYEYFICSNEN